VNLVALHGVNNLAEGNIRLRPVSHRTVWCFLKEICHDWMIHLLAKALGAGYQPRWLVNCALELFFGKRGVSCRTATTFAARTGVYHPNLLIKVVRPATG
jgi:hypothetical protein